jgi:hypothetical protein
VTIVRAVLFMLPLVTVFAVQWLWWSPSEPFLNGDETRHVMTGVFVHDAIQDAGYRTPKAYAQRYYAQYPCLGLLVWPPGFYALQGVAMTVFGPTFEVGRWTAFACCLVACAYLFGLANRTHGPAVACLAALVFGLCRETFEHSRAVMLEVPTVAAALGFIFHFERYLDRRRRWELLLVGFWLVVTGLMRYDAVVLLPYVLLRLAVTKRFALLRRWDVLLTVGGVLVALAPVYGLAAMHIGDQHAIGATAGTNEEVSRDGWDGILYYPYRLWHQLGFYAAEFAVIGGLVALVVPTIRAKSGIYLALIAATYGTFTPMAEQESRHSIYWLPAWAVLAAESCFLPWRLARDRLVSGVLAFLLVLATSTWILLQPVPWVQGYGDAAKYVLANSRGPTVCLFDGLMDGTFIYEMRAADPTRRVWVYRGDKLFYAVRSDPAAGYKEWVETDADLRRRLEAAAPDFIVLEDPPLKYDLPMPKRLRAVLAAWPERFERVETLSIRNCNKEFLDGGRLVIYRSRRPAPANRRLEMPMLWGGTTIRADVPQNETGSR